MQYVICTVAATLKRYPASDAGVFRSGCWLRRYQLAKRRCCSAQSKRIIGMLERHVTLKHSYRF